jgi:3-isopropylmalate dehydrogenase
MCLRYSFNLGDAADALERSIANVLGSGLRTKDVAAPGANAIGTVGMGDALVTELRKTLK